MCRINSLDELPPNILLIRLLEGLKQNMRVKNNRLTKTPNQTPLKMQMGKLSVLHHQTPTSSSNQRQLIKNSINSNNDGLPSSLQATWKKHAQQFISPIQQLAANGHSIIYGNLATQSNLNPSTHYQIQQQQQKQQNNRAQLNLDNNTLVKQPLTDTTALSTNLINTPNLPAMSSIINSNMSNLNSSSNPFVLNNQLINKPIMLNARALRDSDQTGNWSIKKNDILFIKEQLNPYWYLAVFNNIQGELLINY